MKMQTTTKNELLDRVTKRLIEDGRKTASSSELKSAANKMLKDVRPKEEGGIPCDMLPRCYL